MEQYIDCSNDSDLKRLFASLANDLTDIIFDMNDEFGQYLVRNWHFEGEPEDLELVWFCRPMTGYFYVKYFVASRIVINELKIKNPAVMRMFCQYRDDAIQRFLNTHPKNEIIWAKYSEFIKAYDHYENIDHFDKPNFEIDVAWANYEHLYISGEMEYARYKAYIGVVEKNMRLKLARNLLAINEFLKMPGYNGHSNQKGGCYIATAVYGSYDCPEVWVLRRFRDNVLSKWLLGKMFINFYYLTSPLLVKSLGGHRWFKKLFSYPINVLVKCLRKYGFEDTPYMDKDWN